VTRQDVAAMLMVVRREWPHSNVAAEGIEATVEHWLSVLSATDATAARAALLEMVASEREHAPRPGLIVQAAAARAVDVPDFDEAWEEIGRLMMRHNPAFPGREQPPAAAFSHPAVAAFALPAWRELYRGPAPGTNGYGTHYAQQREAWRAMAARSVRAEANWAVGAPRKRDELTGAGGALERAARRAIGGPT